MNTFHAIVVNYIVCVLTGLIFSGNKQVIFTYAGESMVWVGLAAFLGLLFISAFYMMALAAQRVSVAVSTVASKMSLIVPVLFSIIVLQSITAYSWINYTGMVLAVVAVVMASVKRGHQVAPTVTSSKDYLLIGVVFLFTGMVDTTVNYSNTLIDGEDFKRIFPLVSFGFAALFGLVVLGYRTFFLHEQVKIRSILGGIYLGVPNYFSIYFLMKALGDFGHDGAYVYPLLNISVILFTAFFAWLLFKEKLTPVNRVGVFLSFLAIIFLSWEDLVMLFS